VIRRSAWSVSVFDSPNLPRAIRIAKQLKNFSEVIVGPRSAAAGLDVIRVELCESRGIVLDEVPQGLAALCNFAPTRIRLAQHCRTIAISSGVFALAVLH